MNDMKVNLSGHSVWFWCPGCKSNHRITLDRWTWNENPNHPTFTPSLITDPDGPTRCHLTVSNGIITYCNDCHHDMKGKFVLMEDFNCD